MSEEYRREMVLPILNRHSVDCGVPPGFDRSALRYASYFEDAAGDQWFFMVDDSGVAAVYCGDADWEKITMIALDPALVEHLNPGFAVSAWLAACWEASHGLRAP